MRSKPLNLVGFSNGFKMYSNILNKLKESSLTQAISASRCNEKPKVEKSEKFLNFKKKGKKSAIWR